MQFFIWLFFIAGVLLNLYTLSRIDVRRLDFIDGALIGHAYYIMIPLTFFLIMGQAVVEDLSLMYRPFVDLGTTTVLLEGMFLFPLLRLLLPRLRKGQDSTDPRLLRVMLIVFLVSTVASFLMIGLGGGGHWQESLGSALEGNPLVLLTKHASNVSRNAVFGLLLYAHLSGRLSARMTLGIGLVVSLLDLFMTFNRITAVYLLLVLLLMLHRRPVVMAAVGAVTLTLLSSVSVLWPMFRGLATSGGYSLDSVQSAAEAASANTRTTSPIDFALNGVFESSNISVLDWIVKNTGSPDFPFLHGEMFVRPLTVMLPSFIWPDRPQNFGLALGDRIAHINGLALNSTLYGEPYANFGLAWPLALGGFLAAAHLLYWAIDRRARGVGAMGAFCAIAIWRFDSAFVGVAILFTAMIVIALHYIQPRIRRRRAVPAGMSAYPARLE